MPRFYTGPRAIYIYIYSNTTINLFTVGYLYSSKNPAIFSIITLSYLWLQIRLVPVVKMVKCETGFRKLANNRRGNSHRKRLHLPKNRSNPHGNLEVDEIADNSIVDIDLII